MNTYNNIANELRVCFNNHPVLRRLLPLDALLVFGALGVIFITSLIGVVGMLAASLVSSVFHYVFILGIILAYANFHNIFVYSGLFAYGSLHILVLLRLAMVGRTFSATSLVTGITFLLLGCIALKQSNAYSEDGS